MGSKVVRADFGSGLICPRAQTCCASPTRTPARLANSPGFKSIHCPRSESNSRSNVFQISRTSVCVSSRCLHSLLLEMGNQCRKTTLVAHFGGSTLQCLRASVCVPSRWKVLSGEFRRRPTEFVIKLRNPDRVGRRGLSEPREDFSRLLTYAWTQKWFVQI
jgi:hypothetical protein